MTTTTWPRLLTIDELAEYLGVSKRTLDAWRLNKQGPPSYRFGKHVRYPEDKLILWMAEHADEVGTDV